MTGCLEGEERVAVYGDGSGSIELELVLSKRMSELQLALLGTGKRAPEQVQVEALCLLEDHWRGVCWEQGGYEVKDGRLKVSAKGVFTDIKQVKVVHPEVAGEGEQPRDVLSFGLEKTADGGALAVKFHGEADAANLGLGELPPEARAQIEQALDTALKEAFGELKLTIALGSPGAVERLEGELSKLADGRPALVLDLAAIKRMALAGKQELGGKVVFKGATPAPAGFAERLAKAKAAWEQGKATRAAARKRLGGPDPKELEQMEKDLERQQKELEELEKGLGGDKKPGEPKK
ncbi:MAG: hypothetical protein AB7N76_32990 [Planctomycetota bacterium]